MQSDLDSFSFERLLIQQGFHDVAGVDEVGRGPLAGPVMAACVILPSQCAYTLFRDSKTLSALQREKLYAALQGNGSIIGVGSASSEEIASHNIHHASLLAMKRAVEHCALANQGHLPQYLLVDGKYSIPLALPQSTLIRGEGRSASIAAASIVAKVTRDRLMAQYHKLYPVYNFVRNQGYPTKEHRQAIQEHGVCPLHRRSFRGVREYAPTGCQQTFQPLPFEHE